MESLYVLAVDDEPGMRRGVERSLARFSIHISDVDIDVNFETASAESGEEAIEMIQQRQPDILLLDHKLPGITGLEVLEAVGRRDGMLAVMITAYASLETAVSAIKLGAYDFLAKPFTPNELKSTVRKAAENLILTRQARKLAEEKRQVRFQFIRVLAHELKAPLNAVEGFLDIVLNKTAGDSPEVYDDMLGRSVNRIQHMRKLIMDLLDLTRIESGQKSREVEKMDLRQVVDIAIESALPAAQERDITINLDCPASLEMLGDTGEMEIILNNLISNAVKYNRDCGQVAVSINPGDEEITIIVKDTGIGLTREEADKLFGDFVRIKNKKTRGIQGSGLGLAILKKLSQLYGGNVSVDSEPDVGTTFTVRVKRYLQPEADEGEDEDSSATEVDSLAAAVNGSTEKES